MVRNIMRSATALTTCLDTLLSKNCDQILSTEWRRVIFDEAHVLRNMKTKRFDAALRIKARFHWCLTGTPIQNGVCCFQFQ